MATYTVQPGDNLSSIAQKLGLSNWNQLSGYGSNPSLIHPGQTLTYNAPGSSATAAPTSAPAPAASTSPTPNSLNIQPLPAITSTDVQNAQNAAANEFAPQKAALTTDLTAKLQQNLAASNNQIENDLSSKGFLRSGQQTTSEQLANTVAQSDLALQEAGYLQNIDTEQQQYAQGLLQDQVNNLGYNYDSINQSISLAQNADSLLTNPQFTYLMTSYPSLAQQLLQANGIQLTA